MAFSITVEDEVLAACELRRQQGRPTASADSSDRMRATVLWARAQSDRVCSARRRALAGKVLVLGATGRTGRLVVEVALARGWQVTAYVNLGRALRAGGAVPATEAARSIRFASG